MVDKERKIKKMKFGANYMIEYQTFTPLLY